MNRTLYDLTAMEAQARVTERIKDPDFLIKGYHFCRTCEKVTENIGEETSRCCWCGSSDITFHPPVDS